MTERAGRSVDVRELAAGDLAGVAGLCERELTLDRDAGALPAILARDPHVGLVAASGTRLLGACFGSAGPAGGERRTGFIDLLVVDSAVRRQGIGGRLVDGVQSRLAAAGCQVIAVRGHGVRYGWAGIDVGYTAAICMAEDLGYQRGGCEVDMTVDLLTAPLDTHAAEERLRSAGIVIRRADAADDGPLQASLAAIWIPDWIAALTAALRDGHGGLHVALQGERYVGFCAYGVNRLHETGPLGTSPDLRGLGIGGTLIKRCLADLRDRGLSTADLSWAGPLSYFSRTLNAVISRTYWQYEKDLAASGRPARWQDRIGLL
jgi:predicted N-acetyltransferase YhbS